MRAPRPQQLRGPPGQARGKGCKSIASTRVENPLAALFALSEKRLNTLLVLRCRLGPPRSKSAAPRLAQARTDDPWRHPRTAIALLARGRGAGPAPALEPSDKERPAARPR